MTESRSIYECCRWVRTWGPERIKMVAPEGYMEVSPPFTEGGLIFAAWQPETSKVDPVLILQVFRGEDLLSTEKINMSHTNVFGLDVSDFVALDQKVNEILAEAAAN